MRKELELEVMGCGMSKDIQIMKLSKSQLEAKKFPRRILKNPSMFRNF